MFRIITVEREYGSGGAAIARQLANCLGWPLWDEALTNEIARLGRVDPAVIEERCEKADPLLYRLAKVFLRGSFERSLLINEIDNLDAESIWELMRQVIAHVAEAGESVIVGRGSPYFLRDRTDVFRVFLFAPREEKLRRVMAFGKSAGEAAHLIDTIDHERAAFIKQRFGAVWPHRPLYHLMLNTQVGDALVVETILGQMKALNGA